MNKKRNLFDIILNIIILILSILIIYWLIQLIFGGSPGLSEFNFSLIILIIGFTFRIYREIGEIKIGIKHSFNNIKSDVNVVKSDINDIKSDMILIKKKLKV